MDCSTYVVKTKALINCTLVFTYAAHLSETLKTGFLTKGPGHDLIIVMRDTTKESRGILVLYHLTVSSK